MVNRREFMAIASTATVIAGDMLASEMLSGQPGCKAIAQDAGNQPTATNRTAQNKALGIAIDLPRGRVPLSFIIDDSTCLVNMGKFCMPQFASAWPDRDEYKKPWQEWPAEIPDSFVREFGTFCAEHDVRGKYSIVPYPACVGWMDRELPGWSRKQLQSSLQLVRDLMVPRWDIHPEMITHTRVIDLKTGRPLAEISAATMENSFPQQAISVDELTAYLAYALKILKNCDLPCEGITTPGGFGNKVKDILPIAVSEAVRDVYGSELPHYFKYVSLGDQSVLPRFENVQNADSDSPTLTVNVPAGTGDWFGGWDGAIESQGLRYCNEDATAGRMVELIEQRQPAVMLCHWPGLYCNGSLAGYRDFQKVVLALEGRFKNQTQWMKVSDIGRYWTAKEFTQVERTESKLSFKAPYSCQDFTVQIDTRQQVEKVLLTQAGKTVACEPVPDNSRLLTNRYFREPGKVTVCFELLKGNNQIELVGNV